MEETQMAETKKFKFVWFDGKEEIAEAATPSQALTHLGYSAGALATLDYWKEIKGE
jgi:hypothetical protein